LFPDLSTMAHVLRSQFNQHGAFVKPLVAWLTKDNVNFVTGAFVKHIGFAQSPGRMVVDRLDYQRDGAETSVAVAPEDIVLVTIGSQAADLSAGSMKKAPAPKNTGRSWALWKQLAKEHKCFGNPDAFFGPTSVWWGYGLYPERIGNYVTKRMGQCTGEEILEELLRHLRFSNSEAIMSSSICIPCNLPYVNNIWLPRKRGDRPPVVPDIAFTFEYSTRSAWEAIHRLLKRGPAPPPVYQGQFDPRAFGRL
jgi:oleate hydratase